MSIKRTIIATIAALALVATIAPVQANAATVEELMAQLAALQAQLSALQGGTTGGTTTTGTVPSACVGVTFSRNLTLGSTGTDVKCLQQILNATGFPVAATGAGSPGAETTYFGNLTLTAVRAYQVAKGFTPANQVGPLTRQALNAYLTSAGTGTGTGTGTTTQTGPVSAVLSFDNPAAASLVNSQATANLLKVNFTGSGTVTAVTLQRSGISDQNTLTNVYLYDGDTRITDGYSFNTNGTLTMTGLSIPVSGSKVVTVRADIYSQATATASSIAVALTGFTANGVASTVYVAGNTFQIVTGTPATATLSANTVTSGSDITINAGTNGYRFWSAPLQVNTRSLQLKGASFRIIGSADYNAITNVKLYVDGVQSGNVGVITTIQGSNYVVFNTASSPVTLTTGTHTLEVRADVQGGADRTVQLSLQNAADLTLLDSQIGVNIAVGGTVPNSAKSIKINAGSSTFVVENAFSSQTDIPGGATNAVIGKFTLRSYGEAVKVNNLTVTPVLTNSTPTAAGTGLNNVTLYFNGSQVGSSQNWNGTTALVFQLGNQMIIPFGQDSTLEVRADLQSSTNIAYTAGTVQVGVTGSDNAEGQTSHKTTTVSGSTTTGLTIASGSLQVAANPSVSGSSIAPNATGVKIGSYTIRNSGTSEAIRLTSLRVKLFAADGTTPLSSSSSPLLTNFSALRTSETSGSGSYPIQPSADDTFSIDRTLNAGQSITIDIFADTASETSGSVITNLQVGYIGATSNVSGTAPSAITYTVGQTMALGIGSISQPTLVVSQTTAAQYIPSATSGQASSKATFSFISTSGASTINELRFTVSASTTVASVCVGSVCATPISGTATLTGLNLSVPVSGGLNQEVTVTYPTVGTNGLTPGTNSQVSLSYVKYISGGQTKTMSSATGSSTNTQLSPVTVDAPIVTLVGSIPTVTINSGSGSSLNLSAQNKIGSVTVKADAQGAIKVRTLTFTVSNSGFSGSPTLTDTPAALFVALAGSQTQISGSSCTSGGGIATITCTLGSDYASDFMIPANQQTTFDLYATVGGTAVSGAKAAISTSLTSAGFVWDDTSTNGVSGTGLTGVKIYGFPTGSYTISQQ
jgi:hypothetical protein